MNHKIKVYTNIRMEKYIQNITYIVMVLSHVDNGLFFETVYSLRYIY